MKTAIGDLETVGESRQRWNSLTTDEKVREVLDAADARDGWVDELTDKFLDEMPSYTSRDSYHIENLMHSHREIAEMMLGVFADES